MEFKHMTDTRSDYRIPIWLDCDPGLDDAFAIVIAACHPKFNLVGLSTVHGNASLENTTYNALSLLTALGKEKEIPVYSGADRPLVREPAHAAHIHGESGLPPNNILPIPTIKPKKDMFDNLHQTILKYEGEISIVAIGALTNLAQFFKIHKECKSKIKSISIMGGGINQSNTGAGEFNVWCDPHAANRIFQDSELMNKTTLIPLELTYQGIADVFIQQRLLNEAKNSNLRVLFNGFIDFCKKAYIQCNKGFDSGPPIHDPLAVAVLLDQYNIIDLNFKFNVCNLHIVENGDLNGKMEVLTCDDDSGDGIKVGNTMDIAKFWDIVLDAFDVADITSIV